MYCSIRTHSACFREFEILQPRGLPALRSLIGTVVILCLDNLHYANTSMQYTAIFHGCKNVNFQMIFLNIFLIFAQNIDCGYTLEPPQ